MEDDRNHAVLGIDVETTVKDFYDNLLVQCLLQHAATARKRSDSTGTRANLHKLRSPWHAFLDKLCFLCDWRPAGKSVVAIGTEKLDHDVNFRLCGQSSHLQEAGPYLEEVLASLVSALGASDDDRLSKAATIAARAITRSEKKICSYHERLRRVLPKLDMPLCDGSLSQFSKVQAMSDQGGLRSSTTHQPRPARQ